jgi:thioredoxin-related protein
MIAVWFRIVLCLSCLMASRATALADVFEKSNARIDDALSTAKKQKRAVLIEFGAQWCDACKEFELKVLSQPSVQRALSGIVYLRYDADDGPGIEAAQRYNVTQFPSFVAVDMGGKIRLRLTYSQVEDATGFLNVISETSTLYEDESSVRANLERKSKETSAVELARWHLAREEETKALRLLDSVRKRNESPAALRVEASRLAARIRRVTRLKRELAQASAELVEQDPQAGTTDDLIIATSGPFLTGKKKQDLLQKVLTKVPKDRVLLVSYIGIAAGMSDAVMRALKMRGETGEVEYLRAMAECYYSNGERTAALEAIDQAISLNPSAPVQSDLREDRKRIELALEEARQIANVRSQVSELWRRVEQFDTLRSIQPPPNVGFSVLSRSVQSLGSLIGAKCDRYAGGDERAYVRLDVDHKSGQIVSHSQYLKENSSDLLRQCIDKEIGVAVLPVTTTPAPRQTMTVIFAGMAGP